MALVPPVTSTMLLVRCMNWILYFSEDRLINPGRVTHDHADRRVIVEESGEDFMAYIASGSSNNDHMNLRVPFRNRISRVRSSPV